MTTRSIWKHPRDVRVGDRVRMRFRDANGKITGSLDGIKRPFSFVVQLVVPLKVLRGAELGDHGAVQVIDPGAVDLYGDDDGMDPVLLAFDGPDIEVLVEE